ncbi:MAG: hypothetical protein Q8L35_02695 [Actinomycetota bacterium]|nr:hypothetical protein [Actinomycetota bacterium]
MKCESHPDVETNIRCANCDRPICPKCMVYTPVGVKCPDCARQIGRAVAGPRPIYYVRAAGAGLVAGPIGGVLLGVVGRMIPFGGLLLALGLGMAMGEVISRAARRNTGPGLQAIAGGAAALAFLTAGYITGVPVADIHGFNGIVFGSVNPIQLLLALVGIYLAAIRLKD